MTKLLPPAALLLVLVLGSCATSDRTQVLVSAAASLTDSFAAMEAAFEDDHQDIDIVLNFAGSSTLREQILAGAPADVFASANIEVMADVAAADLTDGPTEVFATNTLEIAVPAGNPASVSELADFGRNDLVLGLCAAGVPCGDLAGMVLSDAGVTPSVDTYEPNVRALVTKLESGDLDAGIVYATDVIASDGGVAGIAIAEGVNVVNRYPIVVLREAAAPQGARSFVDFVLSAAGRRILADHGFGAP